jgi:hypothetical protein
MEWKVDSQRKYKKKENKKDNRIEINIHAIKIEFCNESI